MIKFIYNRKESYKTIVMLSTDKMWVRLNNKICQNIAFLMSTESAINLVGIQINIELVVIEMAYQ